ncbi:MAG: hypothetical protein ABIH41_04305 [Nanoarchaeota archaeon]
MKEKVSLTIDRGVWKRFKAHCDRNAINMSGKVELLISAELERKDVKYQDVVKLVSRIVDETERRGKKVDRADSLAALTERYIEMKKRK